MRKSLPIHQIKMALAPGRTLPDLLAFRVAATPQGEAYREYSPVGGAWVSTNWREVGQRIVEWTVALAAAALPRGARVAILLPNGLDAVCLDQAALALGAVPVPLHDLDNPDSIAYILADSEASFLMLDRANQWQEILNTGMALPALRQVVLRTGEDASRMASRVPLQSLAQWLATGSAGAGAALPEGPVEEDLAAIVYTSGTTGKPKGVMLSHRNVVSNVAATLARVAPAAHDVFLSCLPLSHTFERTAGYYLPMAAGSCVAYARSVSLLAYDLRTVRPTVLISVPRIYERVYASLQQTMGTSGLRAWLFEQAQAVGWRRFRRRQRLTLSEPDNAARTVLDLLAWPLLRWLVARPVLAQLGGRLRVAVSGGAALSQPVARCFLGLGLPLLQGYGMTEAAPVVAANGRDDNDPATVGRVLPGVEVRIADNNELQVRGPGVMRGYWKRPEDTARVLSRCGWLATGDQAIVEQGRIRILGRLKEIIVTSTGEKVAPADVELAITADKLFAQALVVGENRPFITCVVVLDAVEWRRLASDGGYDAEPSNLAQPTLRQAALERIRAATTSLPHHAVPRAVWLTLAAWTLENNLMTPTLKLKRQHLAAQFAVAVEAMYRR